MHDKLTIFCLGFIAYFVTVDGQCRHGWVQYKTSCYLFSDQRESWTNAQLHCNIYKSALVEITTAGENTFIKNHLKQLNANDVNKDTMYWLGASDFEFEGEWLWSKSSEPLNFEDWNPGQPDDYNHEEDCLQMHKVYDFRWDDRPCHQLHYFICEMESDSTGQIIG